MVLSLSTIGNNIKDLLVIIAIAIIATTRVEASDNYGITHGFMAGGAVLGTAAIYPDATPYVGAAACGWFIYRELQGPGNLFNHPGPSSSADRIMDWVIPCAIGLGVGYYEVKYGVFYPRYEDGTSSINYEWKF